MANVRTPTVTASVRGAKLEVSSLVISNPVNGLANAQFSGHASEDATATSSSAELPAQEMAGRAGALQKYILTTTRTTPDVAISVNDGNGGVINFSGLLAAPSFSTGADSVNMSFSAVHAAAVLDFFEGSIFNTTGTGALSLEQSASYFFPHDERLVKLRTTSPMQLLAAILQTYVEQLNNGPIFLGDATRIEILKSTIARNTAMMELVQKFLMGSVATTQIAELGDAGASHHLYKMRDYLHQVLSREGGLLSNLINTLREDLGLQFVCQLDGSTPGARFELISYVNARPTTVTVSAQEFQFTAGGAFNLPLSGVIVTAPAQYGVFLTGMDKDSVSHQAWRPTMVSYPPATSLRPGARVWEMAPPPWFDSSMVSAVPEKPHASPSIKRWNDAWATTAQTVEKAHGGDLKLLQWWARTKYAYLSLLSSQASLSGPLRAGLQAGRTYLVQISDGAGGTGQLFKGYAANVTHRVSTQGALNASTTVDFSHVQALGYTQAGDSPRTTL
jgi:hypothetical protein